MSISYADLLRSTVQRNISSAQTANTTQQQSQGKKTETPGTRLEQFEELAGPLKKR